MRRSTQLSLSSSLLLAMTLSHAFADGINSTDGLDLPIGASGNPAMIIGGGTGVTPGDVEFLNFINVDHHNNDQGAAGNHAISFGSLSDGSFGRESVGSIRSLTPGLDFYTNSLERMTITNGGNIGIGTTTPAGKLDVEGSGGVLLNAGMVGIGTTAPGYALDVENNQDGSIEINVGNNSDGTDAFAGFASESTSGALILGMNGLNDDGGDAIIWTYGDVDIAFGAEGAETMVITSGGMVGIGTDPPNYTLDVAGTINASGKISSGGNVLTSDRRLKKDIQPLAINGIEAVELRNKQRKQEAPTDPTEEPTNSTALATLVVISITSHE